MTNFKELRVWNEARELVMAVYCATKKFPSQEQFGLTSQLRRAVVSIAANIAEGSGQNSDLQFKRFLNMSYGSASEVNCLIHLAFDLEFISEQEKIRLEEGITNVQKMLHGFIQKLGGD